MGLPPRYRPTFGATGSGSNQLRPPAKVTRYTHSNPTAPLHPYTCTFTTVGSMYSSATKGGSGTASWINGWGIWGGPLAAVVTGVRTGGRVTVGRDLAAEMARGATVVGAAAVVVTATVVGGAIV